MFDKFHEECGVVGVYGHPEAATLAYLGLYALQHRGQDLLVEDLRHVAHAAVADEGLPVRGHDARRLLPPVLEGVEAQVRDGGRLRMAEDTDDAALLVELVEHPAAPGTLADAGRRVYRRSPSG